MPHDVFRIARAALIAGAAAVALPRSAFAQAIPVSCGCSTDPTTQLGACLTDIAALPPDPLIPMRIVNDIFRTTDGHDARALTFGSYYRGERVSIPPFPSGTTTNPLAGGMGSSNSIAPTYSTCSGCNCTAATPCSPTACTSFTYANNWDATNDTALHEAADQLDWRWWQLFRGTWESGWQTPVADQTLDCADINNLAQCSYNPLFGLIYDLHGEANRIAIFAVTDHTENCLETFEWSVWLSDNANATDIVRDGEAPDPMRWNRARLDQIFLQGWTRNPLALGTPGDTHDLTDTSNGDAIADSPTVVFSLPCGVTFRYASIVAGNYGNPGPHCEFDSWEDEVDAVAGLNADNTRICPDADGDGYRDAACGGTDCNDADPNVHPGAVETCASGHDLNCDGVVTSCPSGTSCFQNLCVPECLEGACGAGFTCVTADAGRGSYCVPNPCVNVTCPAGQVCGPLGCQDPCAGAVCPVGLFCRGGACLDPCQGLACPTQQHCEVDSTGTGHCVVDCTCAPCSSPETCNTSDGKCEAPGCAGITCPQGDRLVCAGPSPYCVPPCLNVVCPLGQLCEMTTGLCARDACFGVACTLGEHCASGRCVADTAVDSGTTSDASMDVQHDVARDLVEPFDSTSSTRDAAIDGDGGRTANTNATCICALQHRGARRTSGREFAALIAVGAVCARRRRRRRPA